MTNTIVYKQGSLTYCCSYHGISLFVTTDVQHRFCYPYTIFEPGGGRWEGLVRRPSGATQDGRSVLTQQGLSMFRRFKTHTYYNMDSHAPHIYRDYKGRASQCFPVSERFPCIEFQVLSKCQMLARTPDASKDFKIAVRNTFPMNP